MGNALTVAWANSFNILYYSLIRSRCENAPGSLGENSFKLHYRIRPKSMEYAPKSPWNSSVACLDKVLIGRNGECFECFLIDKNGLCLWSPHVPVTLHFCIESLLKVHLSCF